MKILAALFGCIHDLGWPRASKHSSTGFYRTCLDCGKELEVDPSTWQPIGQPHVAPIHIPFDGTERGWEHVA